MPSTDIVLFIVNLRRFINDELPTSLPVKGHCAYSVFDVRVTPAPVPTAAIASVAKSK